MFIKLLTSSLSIDAGHVKTSAMPGAQCMLLCAASARAAVTDIMLAANVRVPQRY